MANLTVPLSLALTDSQLLPMLLSFAAMFAFAGIAVWLWLRQRQAPRSQPSKIVPPKPAPAQNREPERSEPTEFVALPGQREEDSPEPAAGERTEFVPPPSELTAHVDAVHEQPAERTEFVTPFAAAPVEERTEFVTPFAAAPPVEDRTEFVTPFAAAPPVEEHTSFVAPPVEDRTSFVAPPVEDRSFVALPVEERTSFVAPPVEERTSFVAPPVEERTSFVAPPVAPPTVTSPGAQPAAPPPPPRLAARDQPFPEPVRARDDSPLIQPTAAPTPAPAFTEHTADLREHFELAVAAATKLEQREDTDEATRLHGHLEVLASAAIDPLLELLRPVLADPDSARVDAAWLALLQHKTWPAKRELPLLLDALDDRSRTQALRTIASWDDPRATAIASAALEHTAANPERHAEWLELFASRGWDPGDAAIDQALSSTHARLLVAGLQLAGSRPAEQVRSKVSAQVFAADPAVRIEAIEAALIFREQSAWLVCRQLARNPAFPRAAELVGLLGSEAEVAQLCQAAGIAGSAPLLWGLGLSGRAIALEACAAALDDAELQASARAALTLALGSDDIDSPQAAREAAAKHDAPRLIAGAPRTLTAISQHLAARGVNDDALPLRPAIARELRIRAHGRVILTPQLRPRAWRRQLDALAKLDLDLDRDFPW